MPDFRTTALQNIHEDHKRIASVVLFLFARFWGKNFSNVLFTILFRAELKATDYSLLCLWRTTHSLLFFRYHGEKLQTFIKPKNPRRDSYCLISTIYDDPHPVDSEDQLLRRQPPISMKYRQEVSFVQARHGVQKNSSSAWRARQEGRTFRLCQLFQGPIFFIKFYYCTLSHKTSIAKPEQILIIYIKRKIPDTASWYFTIKLIES